MRIMQTIFIAAGAAILLPGCASITEGTDQTLVIGVRPREAKCTVMRESAELGRVSGTQPTITVSKGARDILVNCSADGYDPQTQRLVSSTQTAGVMSFMFLDLGITDMMTGAMWKYPSTSAVNLERTPPTSSPPIVPTAQTAIVPAVLALPVAPASTAGPLTTSGQDSFQVERMGRDHGCNPNSRAAMTAKGPGFELYTLHCSSEITWSVRCELGQCRVLR